MIAEYYRPNVDSFSAKAQICSLCNKKLQIRIYRNHKIGSGLEGRDGGQVPITKGTLNCNQWKPEVSLIATHLKRRWFHQL